MQSTLKQQQEAAQANQQSFSSTHSCQDQQNGQQKQLNSSSSINNINKSISDEANCTSKLCNINGSNSGNKQIVPSSPVIGRPRTDDRTILFPPQWIQCDLRYLDMSILGL